LALDADRLRVKLKKHQAFIWIKRKVDESAAMAVKRLDLPGVGLTEENRRYYPQENLAAHVLGFTGIDSQGLDGVELTFDSYLRGRPGGIIVEYDAQGQEIPNATQRYAPPIEGQNVYLTIDMVIQQIAERELDKVLVDTQAQAATIIVMQPYSGEILALANRPDYNPNNFADYSPKLWRDIAISNAYEPGSTFKVITTAAALGEHVVTLEDRFFDPGSVEVQGRTIHCWKAGGHGSQSFLEVVKNSCNVGFVNVGLRLGAEAFYRYINKFGFGRPTNIDLPGEARGIVLDETKVTPINIATMAIGQSIAVTPIQLLTAVAAVANGGELLRPQIVREVRDKSGTVIRAFRPDLVARVLDAQTAETEKGILEKVVEEGTGKNTFIEGLRIAGKTGTAQKVGEGGYVPGKYVASFVGFAPADKPVIAMIVIIDEPVGPYYGGVIAAPVFRALAQDILQYLKVTPQPESAAAEEQAHVVVPGVINFLVADAVNELQKAGLGSRIEESGARVTDQVPKPGSLVPPGSKIMLYTLTPRYSTGEVTVPDLTGLNLREAADILAELGLSIDPSGTGEKAVRQEALPGSKVLPGTVITVYFE